MNNKLIVMMFFVVLFAPISVLGYSIENGKVLLDNRDIADIIEGYDGDSKQYVADIIVMEGLAPKLSKNMFLMAKSSVEGNPKCQACIECSCTDTDVQDDIEVKGTVDQTYTTNGFPVIATFYDVCKKDLRNSEGIIIFPEATEVLQFSCDGNSFCNFFKLTLYDCPNKDCNDGTCSKAMIPEFTTIGLLLATVISIVFIVIARKK